MCGARHKFACSNSIIDVTASFLSLWKLRTRLIAGIVFTKTSYPCAEYSCDKHHVCAFSRRPHIQLYGEDLSGRQLTARCKVLAHRLLRAVQYYLSLPRKLETDNCIPFFDKRTSDIGMIWDSVATFQGSATLS